MAALPSFARAIFTVPPKPSPPNRTPPHDPPSTAPNPHPPMVAPRRSSVHRFCIWSDDGMTQSTFEPNLYAKRDGDRKPWWIVAVRSLPEAHHDVPINEWRLCVTEKERDTFGMELLQKHGTNGVHFCVAEGYWNIDG